MVNVGEEMEAEKWMGKVVGQAWELGQLLQLGYLQRQIRCQSTFTLTNSPFYTILMYTTYHEDLICPFQLLSPSSLSSSRHLLYHPPHTY